MTLYKSETYIEISIVADFHVFVNFIISAQKFVVWVLIFFFSQFLSFLVKTKKVKKCRTYRTSVFSVILVNSRFFRRSNTKRVRFHDFFWRRTTKIEAKSRTTELSKIDIQGQNRITPAEWLFCATMKMQIWGHFW